MNISFFIAASTSVLWAVYCVRFLTLLTGSTESLFYGVMTLFFPVAVVWGVFAVIYNFYKQKNDGVRMFRILELLKKNIENTENLIQRVLCAEADVKNGFFLQQVGTLIADINEILSDIIRRSNSVSSIQMEHLWTRTAGGERWLIAKTFIEINGYQTDFSEHLLQKAQKDSLLKGSILEFCVRYRSICDLLGSCDKQRIFYSTIEYGALGKVFSILSPLAETLNRGNVSEVLSKREGSVILKKSDDFTLKEEPLSFPSFLTASAPIGTRAASVKKESVTEGRSMVDVEEGMKAIRDEILSSSEKVAPKETAIITDFSQTRSALRDFHKSVSKKEKQSSEKVMPRISLDEIEKEINASPDNNYDEYAYPFGKLFDDKSGK